MPIGDTLTRLGDAIAGVDRQGAYLSGLETRGKLDYQRTATEAALELARQRRADTVRAQLENQAIQQLSEMETGQLANPDTAPLGLILAGKAGSDYAGGMLGRGRGQEFNLRQDVANPDLGEAVRVAAMEALAPGSGISARNPSAPEPLEITVGPDGQTVYTPRSQAAGMTVGARPSTPAGAGGYKSADANAIYRQVGGLFGGFYDPITGGFGGLDPDQANRVQMVAARAEELFNAGDMGHTGAVLQALREYQGATGSTGLGQSIAAGAAGAGDVTEGATAVNPSTGERLILRNGQWESLGRPVTGGIIPR